MREMRSQWRRIAGRPARLVTLLAMLVVATAVAACGSSSSTGGGSGNSTSASTGGTSTCAKQAAAGVAKYSASPPLKVGAAIDMAKLAGKSVWYINDTNASSALELNQSGFQAAAKAAGVKVTTFNANGTSAGMNQGLQSAIAAHPAGIVIAAIAADLVGPQLKAAEAAKIPVVSMYEPEDSPGQFFATVLQNSDRVGGAMADLAMSETNCKFTAGYFQDPNFTTQTEELEGLNKEVKRLCPTNCTVLKRTYDTAQIATAVAADAKQLVVSNSSVNVMFPSSDDAAEFMVPALKEQGFSGTIVSAVGLPVGINFVRTGESSGDMAQTPDAYDGWAAFDQIARAMAGMTASPYDEIDSRLITKDNVPSSASAPAIPTYTNYESVYKKNWGLG